MAFHEEGNVLARYYDRVGPPYARQAVVVILKAIITIRLDHFKYECTLF